MATLIQPTSDDIRSLRHPVAMCCESWEFRKICSEGSVFPHAVLVADINDDGFDEYVIGTTEGQLVVMSHQQRNPLFSTTLAATISVVLHAPKRHLVVVITLEGQCELREAVGGAAGGGGNPNNSSMASTMSRSSAMGNRAQSTTALPPPGGNSNPMSSTCDLTSLISTDAVTLSLIASLTIPANCTCGDINEQGHLLFLGSSDRRVYVYDLIESVCIGSVFLNSQVFAVRSCAVLPKLPLLIIGTTTDLVALDAQTHQILSSWDARLVNVGDGDDDTAASATDDDAQGPTRVQALWAYRYHRDAESHAGVGGSFEIDEDFAGKTLMATKRATTRVLRETSTASSLVAPMLQQRVVSSPVPPVSSGVAPMGSKNVRLPVAVEWISPSEGRVYIAVLSEDGYLWLFHLYEEGRVIMDASNTQKIAVGDGAVKTRLCVGNIWSSVSSIRLFRSMIQRIQILPSPKGDDFHIIALACDGTCFMVDSDRNVSATNLRPDVCSFAALKRAESVLVVCLSVDEVVEYIVTPADPTEPAGSVLHKWDSSEQDVLQRLAERLFPVEFKTNRAEAMRKVEFVCLYGLDNEQWQALANRT
ncbi:Hypothetical protein, putative [Bodo saltans]|uniref:Uncharacterized protein n=1 Tax=Bodo saltans TaxID=75058 RepID=A0A0S4J0C2_BODSA|nr:Hypothetical protein, putative [Bodo saltans]|eukprot:CUG41790.1 Hypothetical protein, putative [Bodo saltans]